MLELEIYWNRKNSDGVISYTSRLPEERSGEPLYIPIWGKPQEIISRIQEVTPLVAKELTGKFGNNFLEDTLELRFGVDQEMDGSVSWYGWSIYFVVDPNNPRVYQELR
jgi:hypothetical protein